MKKNQLGALSGHQIRLPSAFGGQPCEHILAWYDEQRERKWEANRSATLRLQRTVEWMAQCCRDGALASYARLRIGGGLWPVSDWEWNVDAPLDQFVRDGGPKRHFPKFQHTGPYEAYLFFRRADLEALFDRLALAPLRVSDTDLSNLSPYLQFAVRLALKKQYFTKDQCETSAVREAEIRAMWKDAMGDVPMTKNVVQMIARVIGFPDPLAIQRGKKGGRAKSG